MDNPANEIVNVAKLVTAAVNPDIQYDAVMRYYAQDCAFRHPLCAVAPGRNSRAKMLAILQWYRIMSPALEIHVSDVTYDDAKMTAFLDITQTFHIRWSPLRPAPARLLVRLQLRPEPSISDSSKTVYVIAQHEDFYHPDDLAALVVPPLVPLIRFVLFLATWACVFNSRFFMMFGFWAVRGEEGEKTTESMELEDRSASTSRKED